MPPDPPLRSEPLKVSESWAAAAGLTFISVNDLKAHHGAATTFRIR